MKKLKDKYVAIRDRVNAAVLDTLVEHSNIAFVIIVLWFVDLFKEIAVLLGKFLG